MTEKARSVSPLQPWSHQKKQWAGVMLALLIAALAGWVLREHVRATRLQATCDKEMELLQQDRSRRNERKQTLSAYRDLVRKHSTQRERLIVELSEFQKELDVLKAQTKGLEDAKEALGRLERAFEKHKEKEAEFLDKLKLLEQVLATRRGVS